MPERRGPLASFEAAATADGYRECERCGVWVHPRSAPPFKCGQDCDTPGSEAVWLREGGDGGVAVALCRVRSPEGTAVCVRPDRTHHTDP